MFIVMINTQLTVSQLLADVLGLLLIRVTLGTQEIGKEDHLDDDKENKQFDADNEPQCLSHSHAAESIVIEMEYAPPEPMSLVLNVAHIAQKVNQLTKLLKKI